MPEITKQDALRWLEMQRDAINTEIAYAAPDDKRQYFGNLKVVNWIVDRIKDMTAVEYLIEMRNIHHTYCDNGSLSCGDCPLLVGEKKGRCALDYITKNPPNIVEIVKSWKEEQDGNAHAEG